MNRIAPLPLLALLLGCEIENEILADFPTTFDAVCEVMTTSATLGPYSQDRYHGRSVQIVSSGVDPSNLDLRRWVAVGAPGAETDDVVGEVVLTAASTLTGEINPTDPDNLVLHPPSAISNAYQFGWSLLAVDARDCRPGTTPGAYDGCGEELLVSAPDTSTSSTAGRVFWYEQDGDDASAYEYVAQLPTPTSATGGAEFGYAMAAPNEPVDPESPWNVSGSPPPWIAVSAPEISRVYIFGVNPSNTAPFTLLQTLVSPWAGRRFGQSLTAGDFDGDGTFDLAVGMPLGSGTDLEGRVYVYRGNATGTPLRGTPLELNGYALTSSSGGVDTDHFGWSLAAGPFVGQHAGDALLVGAPRSGVDDHGGYCQFVLNSVSTGIGLSVDTSLRRCAQNSFGSTSTSPNPEHLGWSVGVGNFYNVDSVQNTTSAAARHMEVAIGRPGAYNDQGVVNIFSTGISGVDPFSTASNIEEYVGATADARFGESIDAGYVQQTHWQDLLMGAPSHPNSSFADGTASLSQAKEVSTCVELDGTWVAPDDTGYLVGFQITNNEALDTLTVTFLETFVVSLYEDYGLSTERVCQQDWDGEVADATFYLPPGLTLELPEAYDCTGSGKTWTDIEMDDLILALTGVSLPVKMDVAFVATGSGQIEFSLTPNGTTFPYLLELAGIDDGEACQIEPLPLTMTRITTGLCE